MDPNGAVFRLTGADRSFVVRSFPLGANPPARAVLITPAGAAKGD